jgi:RNA polymerase II subunit A small phosphatase-like protein
MPPADRLLVILDLDETLVFATPDPQPRPADFRLGPFAVYRRPHLAEFLEGCARHFRLAFWSSAGDAYVQALVWAVLPAGVEPAFAWGRSRCVRRFDPDLWEEGFLKDLKKVKRRGFALARVVIVDDTPDKVRRNYGNAVYIPAWQGEAGDTVLADLLPYLRRLAEAPDVRPLVKRGWRSRR